MPETVNVARRNSDGFAQIGRTLHDLRGIRFDEGEAGNAPAAAGDVDPGEAALASAIAEASTPAPETVDALPSWAQKIVHDARAEAATHRTSAKTAAEKAQQELTDKIAVALGLKPDAATDPAALTASLTQAQTDAQNAARQLAIYKAAGTTGADPNRLLDSNSFMTSVAGIDPGDGAAITAAIQSAIAGNPILKAVQAAAASGAELGGSGEQSQLTEEQFARIANDPEAIVAAQNAGLLRNILGG